VQMLLGVEIPGPADVTDALAIAITHCSHVQNRRAVSAAEAPRVSGRRVSR